MISHEDILARMGAANPATADDAAMDAEFALLTSLLDQRRSTMTDLDERRTESTPPPIRRPRRRAVAAFAGALIIVLGAIGVVALVRDGGTDGVAEPPSQTAPAATDAVAPEDDLPPDAAVVTTVGTEVPLPTPEYEWSRVTIDETSMPEGTELSEVVHTGSAFWIVGQAEGCAQVWTSPNGDAWTRLAMDPDSALPCGASLSDVAFGTDAMVAVGIVDDAPAIWASSDGVAWAEVGRTGSALRPNDSISAVATGAAGFVAVGTEIWHSADGFEWVQAATPWVAYGAGDQVFFDYDVLADVASGDAGYVALSDVGDWGKDVLFSANGIDWVASDRLNGVAYNGTRCFVFTNGVTQGPSGYVIVGDCVPQEPDDGGVHSSVWTSPDGVIWSQIEFDEAAFGEPALISDVAFDGATYVAVGWMLHDEGDHATVWHSEDGLTWTRSELAGEGDYDMWQVAAIGDTAVAIGHAQGVAAIWLGTR